MTGYDFFDTINDRRARDIRNELGRTFVRFLDPGKDLAPVEELAGELIEKHPGEVYKNYITDRLARFRSAKNRISGNKINDDYYRALVLWDHLLFFETHEVLEPIWLKASGSRKLILQALIRAAGVYIHLANNNLQGAEKMAAKAIDVLQNHKTEVPPFPGLEKLLDSLANLDQNPPKIMS